MSLGNYCQTVCHVVKATKISSLTLELPDAPSLQILCFVMYSDLAEACVCVCTCHCIHSVLPRELKYWWKAEVTTFERLLTMLSCAWVLARSLPGRTRTIHAEFADCLECVETGFLTPVFRHCSRCGDDSVCSQRSKVRVGSGCSEGGVPMETPQTHLSYFTVTWLPFGHCLCLYMGVCVCPLV